MAHFFVKEEDPDYSDEEFCSPAAMQNQPNSKVANGSCREAQQVRPFPATPGRTGGTSAMEFLSKYQSPVYNSTSGDRPMKEPTTSEGSELQKSTVTSGALQQQNGQISVLVGSGQKRDASGVVKNIAKMLVIPRYGEQRVIAFKTPVNSHRLKAILAQAGAPLTRDTVIQRVINTAGVNVGFQYVARMGEPSHEFLLRIPLDQPIMLPPETYATSSTSSVTPGASK